MISKVTEKNKALYEARIAQINEALAAKGSSTRITDLESYFGNLREIEALPVRFRSATAGDPLDGAPGKYLLMPLDEPLFEIDANKRTITVPTEFSKNGIGVRGDHKAETLYFVIDRYFDSRDLYDGIDEIIINWQFRPANASRNAEIPMHTALAFAPDDEYIPDHVVFGWVIGDYQDENGEWVQMTPSKGTLNFSIGFISRTGDKYTYVLNTSIASVNVNDSLHLEDPSIIGALKRPVFERLRDSQYTPANVAPVHNPIWRTGDIAEDINGESMFQGLHAIENFNLKDDGTEDEKLLLQAIGCVTDQDSAIIKYDWTGFSFADDSAIEGRSRESATVAEDYVVTNDLEPQDGIVYYIKPENEQFMMLTSTSSPTLEEAFEDLSIIKYELGSSFEVVEGGRYLATMQAVRTTTQSSGDPIESKSSAVDSIVCIIPHAAIPEVTLTVNSVDARGDANTLPYKIVDEVAAEGFTFVGDNAPNVEAVITKDNINVKSSKNMAGVELIAKKLENAPDDIRIKENVQHNQDAIRVVQKDDNIIIVGKFNELNSFASTNPYQGTAKWIGLDLDLGFSNGIVDAGATWNGELLDQQEEDDAIDLGLGVGHIIFWAKAEALPRTIKLGCTGCPDREFKVSFVDADNFVEEDYEQDDELVLLNARKGIFKESELGRVAFKLVAEDEVPTTADFANETWYKFVEGQRYVISSDNASGEGKYCVYAINERNHTQSISKPSNIINVSKIAPSLSGISLFAKEGDIYDVQLLNNNQKTGRTIEIDGNNLIRYFQLSVADSFDNIGSEDDRPQLLLEAIEIDSNAYDRDGSIVFPQPHPDGTSDVITIDENLRFAIDRDPGTYVIRATTNYHGTERITLTEPFFVTSRLQFD